MTDPKRPFYYPGFHTADEIYDLMDTASIQFKNLAQYKMVLQAQPDIVIIDLGALDWWYAASPDEFR